MGSGAFCLTHRYKDIELDFQDGVHLVCWDDIPDLIEKCKYWLQPENEAERKKISNAGYELVHSSHRWKNRFQGLIEIIKNHTKEKFNAMTKNDAWIEDLKNIIPLPRVYSQYEEESYIGFILNNIGVVNKFLVDIGAGNGAYLSNSRLLLDEYKWNGVLIDGAYENEYVKKHFVTAENILGILKKYGVPEEFDLLSYDTDGNDYFILQKILSKYSPRLIICEYNGTLPVNSSVTIKYNPDHRFEENNYYGFSFEAGKKLAEQFGYRVVFQNNITNMYLVRKDCLANPEAQINVSYVPNPYWAHSPNREWVEV